MSHRRRESFHEDKKFAVLSFSHSSGACLNMPTAKLVAEASVSARMRLLSNSQIGRAPYDSSDDIGPSTVATFGPDTDVQSFHKSPEYIPIIIAVVREYAALHNSRSPDAPLQPPGTTDLGQLLEAYLGPDWLTVVAIAARRMRRNGTLGAIFTDPAFAGLFNRDRPAYVSQELQERCLDTDDAHPAAVAESAIFDSVVERAVLLRLAFNRMPFGALTSEARRYDSLRTTRPDLAEELLQGLRRFAATYRITLASELRPVPIQAQPSRAPSAAHPTAAEAASARRQVEALRRLCHVVDRNRRASTGDAATAARAASRLMATSAATPGVGALAGEANRAPGPAPRPQPSTAGAAAGGTPPQLHNASGPASPAAATGSAAGTASYASVAASVPPPASTARGTEAASRPPALPQRAAPRPTARSAGVGPHGPSGSAAGALPGPPPRPQTGTSQPPPAAAPTGIASGRSPAPGPGHTQNRPATTSSAPAPRAASAAASASRPASTAPQRLGAAAGTRQASRALGTGGAPPPAPGPADDSSIADDSSSATESDSDHETGSSTEADSDSDNESYQPSLPSTPTQRGSAASRRLSSTSAQPSNRDAPRPPPPAAPSGSGTAAHGTGAPPGPPAAARRC